MAPSSLKMVPRWMALRGPRIPQMSPRRPHVALRGPKAYSYVFLYLCLSLRTRTCMCACARACNLICDGTCTCVAVCTCTDTCIRTFALVLVLVSVIVRVLALILVFVLVLVSLQWHLHLHSHTCRYVRNTCLGTCARVDIHTSTCACFGARIGTSINRYLYRDLCLHPYL